MPYINITIHSSLTDQQADRLSRGTIQSMSQSMGMNQDAISVAIQDSNATRWTINGQSEMQTVFIEIFTTIGTNSPRQKARLIEDLHALLVEIFGPITEASYIVIHEIPAQNWGYAGQTQLDRMKNRNQRRFFLSQL